MSTFWLITNLLATLLLPPLSLLLLIASGLILLLWRQPIAGKLFITLGLAGLWALSMPVVADRLLSSLKPTPLVFSGREAEAIVILGGGVQRGASEYGDDIPSRYTLERLRYGAHLARRWHKPLLVSGGAPTGGQAEARIMATTLHADYGLKVRWTEDRAFNTHDNARYSAELLQKDGIRRIYLVTHAWHLARAVPEFQAAGLEVVPAGTGFAHLTDGTPLDWLPRAEALFASDRAIHEWIGLFWYRLHS